MPSSGEPMPDGWVVHSKTGEPITDPKKVGEGVLLPIGGHKGSGLALMIGLLAGVLNGAAFGRDVVDFTGPGTEQTNTGQFIVALDVSRFMPPEVFAAEMDRHLNDLRRRETVAGRRRDPDARRGSPSPPRRPQREWRRTAADSLIKQLDELAAKSQARRRSARADRSFAEARSSSSERTVATSGRHFSDHA